MSRVPDEPRTWSDKLEAEDVAADLRRQLDVVKAKLEEHREIMHLAGLANPSNTESSEPES